MTDEIIRQKLHEWTNGSDPLHARVQVFERVRDIPYTYPASRDPVEVLRLERGSCSGKHYLLGELFRRTGLRGANFFRRGV